MKDNDQTTLKAALLITVLAILTACGAQKAEEGTTDSSSRTPILSTQASSSVLYCNEKTQDGLSAKVMVYTDAANKVRNDYMKVKITKMPDSFATGDYLQFFRWQANTSGQVYMDKAPTQARFETLDGRVLTNFSPVIHWGLVSQIAKNSGMTDIHTFLQHVRLVVDIRDPQANFDVLKIAMYNADNTNKINMDVLMPAFSASPADYALDNGVARTSQLQALHPFADMIHQGWTAVQYQSMATSYCF